MHVFSETASIEIIDGLACAFLAMACALRGRALGANLLGSAILACLSALSAALSREFILHGQQGSILVFAQLPQDAFIGALAGLILQAVTKGGSFFFFMDTLSLSLTAALVASLAAPELGALGAFALAVCASLAPGLIRDLSLGDSALFLEQPWYAASAVVAAASAIMMILLPAFWTLPSFFVHRLGEWAVVCGCLLGLALRYWRGR